MEEIGELGGEGGVRSKETKVDPTGKSERKLRCTKQWTCS